MAGRSTWTGISETKAVCQYTLTGFSETRTVCDSDELLFSTGLD